MSKVTKYVLCVVFYQFSCHVVTKLPEQRNDVTRALSIVIKDSMYVYKKILKIKQHAIWETTHTRVYCFESGTL